MKLLIPSLASVALFSPASAANFMIVSQLGLSDPYVAALTAEFPGSTFSTGTFSDHTAPATLAAVAAADLIIFSRDSNSGSYNQAGEVAFYNDLTIPIIQSNFLILRDNRWGWTDSDATTSATPNGSETTVTPSGAAFLGIAPSPQDFFEDGGNYGSTPATLDFGDGVILANATVGGSVTVAGWSAGDMVANGDPRWTSSPRSNCR